MKDLTQLATQIDQEYLVGTLRELAQVPTEVPLGENTFIEPDDPKLVHYVQRVLRPKIQALELADVVDVPRNQLVLSMGEGTSGASLLVMVYTPTQHHNLMKDPLSGKVESAAAWGFDEPCIFGQGVGQNKSHQAIFLAVLKLLRDQRVKLSGTLYFAVNNEGLSSHRCSGAIIEALDPKPSFAILMTRTGQAISLGNRGRVDINIEVRGKASHSSAPQHGHSAIEGANQVLNRLKEVPLGGFHSLLGRRHTVPYQLTFQPLAPHTLPAVARLRVDRRLLPGDDPDQVADDIRRAIGVIDPYQITVERGEYMLPALCDPDHPGVQSLKLSHREVLGVEPNTFYGQGTFDAGGPCAAGIPAVMYGVGGGDWPLGEDFVPISHLVQVAQVMAHTVLSVLN